MDSAVFAQKLEFYETFYCRRVVNVTNCHLKAGCMICLLTARLVYRPLKRWLTSRRVSTNSTGYLVNWRHQRHRTVYMNLPLWLFLLYYFIDLRILFSTSYYLFSASIHVLYDMLKKFISNDWLWLVATWSHAKILPRQRGGHCPTNPKYASGHIQVQIGIEIERE